MTATPPATLMPMMEPVPIPPLSPLLEVEEEDSAADVADPVEVSWLGVIIVVTTTTDPFASVDVETTVSVGDAGA